MNLQDKINDLLNTPDLAPETRALLRATLEAQETGKIPTDLTRFFEPEPTPGEWYQNGSMIAAKAVGLDGDMICRAPGEMHAPDSHKGWPANAPILAAAKDSNEALKRLDRPGGIFVACMDCNLSGDHVADIEFARAALAKAAMKGGSNE